jgi:glycosyltransferase involved in cell wall biosynthesis
MRIAINAWFLNQPGTGSGQYLHSLLNALPSLAPQDQFLLVAPSDRFKGEVRGLKTETRSPPAPLGRGNLGKVWFEQLAFSRTCRDWNADIAHVPYWGSPLSPSVPTVTTVHDLIPVLLPAYRGGPLVRLYTRLAAASARSATVVLTDSMASKRDIEQHLGLPARQVRCIYLAANEQFRAEPRPEDEAIRQLYNLPHRYVLYLAGHDVRKNVEAIVKAFATVAQADDDVTLIVAGRLPERDEPPFFDPRPLVTSLGLEEDVQFVGWVDEAHKPALYRGAACAVFASRYEGFGLPVLEALACGTPLVSSNTSSLPELVGDAGFALDPDNIQGLAGAMLACLVDETMARELRRRGPVQAARFSWERTAKETLEVYREVAACAS